MFSRFSFLKGGTGLTPVLKEQSLVEADNPLGFGPLCTGALAL
jgi:hypothetical protein